MSLQTDCDPAEKGIRAGHPAEGHHPRLSVVVGIDPVVDPEAQISDLCLLVFVEETGEKDLLLIRSAIAIGIFHIYDVRCSCNQQSSIPWQDAGRFPQTVCEYDRCISPAISIEILQFHDTPPALH
jgi:hypothetical protein